MATLENAVGVLRCFSAARAELTVKDASALLKLPKSNVSRLLRSMRDTGLLDSAIDSRGYRPGVLLIELGQVFRAGRSLIACANDAVRGIGDVLGHTGYVSARVGTDMLGLAHHAGRNAIQVGVPLGRRLSVDACATGRSLLALMSDGEVRTLLGNKLSRVGLNAPATFADLFRRLALVRRLGYAESVDEAGKGVGAFAVAVQDPQTDEALSICITFPSATLDEFERNRVIELLLQARSDILRYHP